MTVTARKFLNDSRHAHDLLELEENEGKFRLLWVACCSLLRTTGHALQNVDSENNADLKKVVNKWIADLNTNKHKHAIFFDFIMLERNNILKEYELGIFSGDTNALISPSDESFNLTENIFCPMFSGAFEGEDCRDVALQAIEWWEEQIEFIENKLSNQSSMPQDSSLLNGILKHLGALRQRDDQGRPLN
jgi:hypothetical protein